MTRLLLVEDRESLRRMMERALAGEGHRVESAADVGEARRLLVERGPFDLVLTDLKLPSGTGLEVLAESKRLWPEVPVVVLTAFGTVPGAVEAMKLGAAEFLEKPVDLAVLSSLVRELTQRDPGTAESGSFEVPGGAPIVGRHPRLRAALRLLERVAPTDSTVLLTGESGTGKELFARALHALSKRASGPFVAVNCAAIPETLVETELFGHEKGAFTGASRRRAGRFELAHGGTLFLDEIGELPPAVQAKVLRVLDDGRFERVGGGETLAADVRVVTATNRDLRAMVSEGGFRSDLLYRLEIFPIALPSLAERASDIPVLAGHLLAQLAERHRVEPPELDRSALQRLEAASWPGNVRQLANVLERAVILHPGARLGGREVESLIAAAGGGDDEAARLRAALVAADGDRRRAAATRGISYRTLLRRIREHDLAGFP
ncbi:MAG TPA: sigma-54 dependent transcriptional regulator, partial [Thermoanaerobaculia bacterium]|nr:sigma-54 dependent transcriptional regulator [Thermoanaerobaculia bacterium]